MSDVRPASHTDLVVTAHELRVALGLLKRKLREQAPGGDLSWSQVAVLGHLERDGPKTVTALAKAEDVRPQSMGATVAALEAMGFVAGMPDPDDGRQTIWSLTDAFLGWVATHRAAREDWLVEAMRRKLTDDERVTLAQAVRLLRRLVET